MRTPYKYTRKRKIVGLHDRLKPRKYVLVDIRKNGNRNEIVYFDTLEDARRERDKYFRLSPPEYYNNLVIIGKGCMSVIDRG